MGKISLEEVLTRILKQNHCYSEDVLKKIVNKRIAVKEEVFCHMNPEIIPMLSALKEKGLRIGLISNCFSEEADVIEKSILYPYFDAPCLSYREGVQKPEIAIYQKCMDKLNVSAEECLYVGDGGNRELETAEKIGMKAVQAVWYLKDNTIQPAKRKAEFEQVETPLDILYYIG